MLPTLEPCFKTNSEEDHPQKKDQQSVLNDTFIYKGTSEIRPPKD